MYTFEKIYIVLCNEYCRNYEHKHTKVFFEILVIYIGETNIKFYFILVFFLWTKNY